MLNLQELEQLRTFADCGRLSAAAEKLNISQPTLTRTMQHLEDEFGVSLFTRSKNRISLNETGWKAVEHARALLNSADQAVRDVRSFDKSLHTITVSSCAPAPLWSLLPELASTYCGQAVASSIKNNAAVTRDLETGECTVAVLPYALDDNTYRCIPFLNEKLSICVTPDHVLAGQSEVSFEKINGHNFLLASHLGFWYDLCIEKMPASRFHVQENDLAMDDLIQHSSLPCFTTDLGRSRRRIPEDRIDIPITDPEADVTFYLVFQADNAKAKTLTELAGNIQKRQKHAEKSQGSI